MYRYLLVLLVCQSVSPAPQALSDSDITYVMLQPPVEAPAAASHSRESRIENLPLTIPGYVSRAVDRNITLENTEPDDANLAESSNLSEITALPESAPATPGTTKPTDLPQQTDLSEQTVLEETSLPEKIESAEIERSDETLPEITDLAEKDELLEAHGSDLADTIPLETFQSERQARTYESHETTDIFEEATIKYEDVTQIPEVVVPRTKPTPRFVPKLSYFQKPKVFVSFPTNSIEKSAKRRFRSHCRCEKIWNCPKLQISVPRCPNEYFLCCF